MRTRIVAASVLVLTVLLAGCASTSTEATNQALTNLPQTPTTAAPSPTTTTAAPPANCTRVEQTVPSSIQTPTEIAATPGSTMAEIQKRGYLRVGIDQNTPGFSYRSDDGTQIQGFEYDIIRAVAKAIFGSDDSKYIRPVALTTAERLPAVESGKVDLAASLITHTCARDALALFSQDYFVAHQDVLVPKSSTIETLADLKGRTVCATSGSTSLANIVKHAPGVKTYPVASRADCLVALQDGRVDAITSDDTVLLGFKAQDRDTRLLGLSAQDLEPEPYAVAVNKKATDLAEFVNGVLAQTQADLELSRAQYLVGLGITDPLPTVTAG